ncbi:hypothetical protein [Loktanella sp. M215]|uniref:nSTAND3 domain-containing NTPase n=1 Tax=Loktanella sp. M215 TaxID=2675431 RepID=UPI001F422CE8|nr:hypothetical protein [Loktanella sp. M215]MCF7699960.1 hypothetical protein [Loktanella sp. M215]
MEINEEEAKRVTDPTQVDGSSSPSAQGPQIDYALHTLGWKSFQDLCVAIAQEVLKRSVETFLPSKDGGRDGAFLGRWSNKDSAGRSTIQCKFTSKADAPLSLSAVKGELSKAGGLAARGLAEDYILLTNHGVSGLQADAIAAAFEAVGVKNCVILGRDWISQQIRESSRLRVMVPRVYGLGDLSQILDERSYAQSRAILSALGDDLACFVVTDAHRQSVDALLDHNFVLLLGDPASGKSTIAASLALGALDHWHAPTIRITSPEDIMRHWNPADPKQFFWIDDAFGATQYQRHIADGWNRQMPLMAAALRKGARFLLTSRTYIWRSAYRDLKTSAFPLLDKSQVVINVQGLATSEKAQILYNHIKRGDQPAAFKKAIKPHLAKVAEDASFLPETARRLGSAFFTAKVTLGEEGLLDFARRPVDFLKDVLRNLDRGEAAAVALIFMHGGQLASPIENDDRIALITELLGVTAAEIRLALDSLRGSLALFVDTTEGPKWTFKHPTIGDAYAALVANSPELTEIYLRGAKFERLLEEVVCGGVELRGASVRVGPTLYPALLNRLLVHPIDYRIRYFLGQRCDDAFLRMVVDQVPNVLDLRPGAFMAYSSENRLLAKLHQAELLPDEKRLSLVEHIVDTTLSVPDGGVFCDESLRSLLTDAEFDNLLERARRDVLNQIDTHISDWKSNCESSDPDSHFDELSNFLSGFEDALPIDDPDRAKIDSGRISIGKAIEDLNETRDPDVEDRVETPVGRAASARSNIQAIFDDVDR